MKYLDPRAKLLWSFAWMISLFLIYSSREQLICLALTLLLIRINGIRLSSVFRSVRYLLMFLPITFLVHLLITSRGWQLFTGELQFSLALLEQPVLFSIRMVNLIILMAFVLKWVRDIEFLDAVYHLLKPLRRLDWAVDDFFQIVFIAIKFFPILQEEYRRLDEGWKVFADSPDKHLAERIQRVRKSLVPLMIFSFQRAETLADAISVRGYHNTVRRSYYQPLSFRTVDWLICGLALSLLVTVIIWV